MTISIPQSKVKHLISRAGFGLGGNEVTATSLDLFEKSKKVTPLDLFKSPQTGKIDWSKMKGIKNDTLRLAMAREMLVKSRPDLMKLNVEWVNRMVSEPTLRERMTFFWHGHFACRNLVPYFAQQQNNLFRESALESFRDLLHGISKDPAMLGFLNNNQNRKNHPNENFAREVMELFTLGRGNYTEQDVKEAARAFTGWSNVYAEYRFRQGQHDFGSKTFRGQTKNFTGEQILDSILEDKATAKFITTRLYKYFVSDASIPVRVVEEWSTLFYKSDYSIQKLLAVIFESNEFNAPSNVGNRIKSPIDLLVGIQRHTNGKFETDQSIVFLQRALGQILFYPPNVSGWTSGKGWIDSSSLAFRITLPMLLFGGAETDFEASDDGDANGLGKAEKAKRRLQCNVDWASLAKQFTKGGSDETLQTVQEYLLSRPTTPENLKNVSRVATAATNDEEFVRKAFIGFMSVPEYQLC